MILTMVETWENNGTEEIVVLTPPFPWHQALISNRAYELKIQECSLICMHQGRGQVITSHGYCGM